MYVRLQYQTQAGEWGDAGPVVTKNFWHSSFHGPMFQGPGHKVGFIANLGAGGVPWSSAYKAFRFWRMEHATADAGCIRATGGASGSDGYVEYVECPALDEQ